VHSYVHHDYKQGALVVAETGKARGDAEEVLKGVCQHIVVFRPTYLTRDEVPADVIARERAIYLEEVKGKPENIQDKIIGGKLEKFYASVCLLEQPWVFDDKLSVKKAIENALGKDARLLSFARFRIGE
jgi:elongation factor Ts